LCLALVQRRQLTTTTTHTKIPTDSGERGAAAIFAPGQRVVILPDQSSCSLVTELTFFPPPRTSHIETTGSGSKAKGVSTQQTVEMAGEFWFQLFSCVAEQEQEQRRRPRIDRSMIGQPMDFRHTGHVGSTDLGSISSLQNQMRGKGGDQVNLQVPHILNARSIHDVQRHSIKA